MMNAFIHRIRETSGNTLVVARCFLGLAGVVFAGLRRLVRVWRMSHALEVLAAANFDDVEDLALMGAILSAYSEFEGFSDRQIARTLSEIDEFGRC